eukprot:TRINITY_DN14620_c0_g1_i2.p1 TRINITY_DN14620_c0_g1~~TRINITY_DN14620_c0_g1_i2.p1  ORF type:complete len:142 (+),score=33.07 TRINITY_DN14620_c0_g1_i2:127-552(+)
MDKVTDSVAANTTHALLEDRNMTLKLHEKLQSILKESVDARNTIFTQNTMIIETDKEITTVQFEILKLKKDIHLLEDEKQKLELRLAKKTNKDTFRYPPLTCADFIRSTFLIAMMLFVIIYIMLLPPHPNDHIRPRYKYYV